MPSKQVFLLHCIFFLNCIMVAFDNFLINERWWWRWWLWDYSRLQVYTTDRLRDKRPHVKRPLRHNASRQKASRQKAATGATKSPRLISCDIRPSDKYEKGGNIPTSFDNFFSFYLGIASCVCILAWNPLRCTYLWRLSTGVECCLRRIQLFF